MYGCNYVKHKCDYCYTHKRILEQLPVHVRLAVIAADLSPRLVPGDVVDFLNLYQEIKADLAMCVICAIVNEPVANELILAQWRQLPPNYEAPSLAMGFDAVVRACETSLGMVSEQPSQVRQMEQLHGEGGARCSGVATCGESGVVAQSPA